jgi:hypothetical protein
MKQLIPENPNLEIRFVDMSFPPTTTPYKGGMPLTEATSIVLWLGSKHTFYGGRRCQITAQDVRVWIEHYIPRNKLKWNMTVWDTQYYTKIKCSPLIYEDLWGLFNYGPLEAPQECIFDASI